MGNYARSSLLKKVFLIVLALTISQAKYLDYKAQFNVSGDLRISSSQAIGNLMLQLGDKFSEFYSNTTVTISSQISENPILNLINGSSHIAAIDNPMTISEMNQFEMKYSYKPIGIRIGLKAAAVYVNINNPIEKISIEKLDSIFSTTRSCGSEQQSLNWKDIDDDLDLGQITKYGLSSNYIQEYFRLNALCGGNFTSSMQIYTSESDLTAGIVSQASAIGFSSFSMESTAVKRLSISQVGEDAEYYQAIKSNCDRGIYPLCGYLFLYLNAREFEDIQSAVREFVVLALSEQGQQILLNLDYLGLDGIVAKNQLVTIGVDWKARGGEEVISQENENLSTWNHLNFVTLVVCLWLIF